MASFTRKNVEARFPSFCYAIGRRPARAWNDVGGLLLDYEPAYGGFVIREVSTASGAQDEPFGSTRHKPDTFMLMMNFAVAALQATHRTARAGDRRRRRTSTRARRRR